MQSTLFAWILFVRRGRNANDTFLQTWCAEQGKLTKSKRGTALARGIPTTAQGQDGCARLTGAALGEHDDTLWRELLADTPGIEVTALK